MAGRGIAVSPAIDNPLLYAICFVTPAQRRLLNRMANDGLLQGETPLSPDVASMEQRDVLGILLSAGLGQIDRRWTRLVPSAQNLPEPHLVFKTDPNWPMRLSADGVREDVAQLALVGLEGGIARVRDDMYKMNGLQAAVEQHARILEFELKLTD